MHRVELKCVLDLEMRMEEFINEFLMHRVELKSFKQRLPKAFMKYVPNAPCGVEILPSQIHSPVYFDYVPNAPCGVEITSPTQ